VETLRRSDRFLAQSRADLTDVDLQVLSLLYQPLIGSGALALYFVLHSLCDRQTTISEEALHGDLESLLSVKTAKLEAHRHKLEAIGLLTTHIAEDRFLYVVQAPLSPDAFVNDGVLGQYLRAFLSKERFQKIIDRFRIKTIKTESFYPITKSFNDVFGQLPDAPTLYEPSLLSNIKATAIRVSGVDFDLRTFRESIPKEFFSDEWFGEDVRSKILTLAYVYGLDELAMKEIYLRSIDSMLRPDVAKLSIYAKEVYGETLKSGSAMEEDVRKPSADKPKDPVEYFQTVSFKTLIEDMQMERLSSGDLRTIERLIDEVGLDKGVVNVLIAYVLQIKDRKMPNYEYFEKLALDWKRQNVTSVKEAVQYVQHLKAEFMRRKNEEKLPKKGKGSQGPDIEVPWLDDYLASLKKSEESGS
jgi:replication initiation and membrane attachment protein